MKLLLNTHGSYITGTAIADSVMGYGLALARRRQIDMVDIPFVDERGDFSRVQLTVGWLIDVTTKNQPARGDELTEDDTVRELAAKTAMLESQSARPIEGDDFSDIGELDWYGIDRG